MNKRRKHGSLSTQKGATKTVLIMALIYLWFKFENSTCYSIEQVIKNPNNIKETRHTDRGSSIECFTTSKQLV